MKAIIYEKYGNPDVLELKNLEKPVPGDNEVLIKIHAASLAFGDAAMVKGDPYVARFWSGLLKPINKTPGSDMAGCIEAVGKNIRNFKPGDEVFGDLSGCGFGALAEYVCTGEKYLAVKPENITFQQAAAVPISAVTALQGLRMGGQIRQGQKVLINGASGGVGTFALQIAKSYGAEVTAVCSTDKIDMVRSIGADFVIDYSREDFTENGKSYDKIFGVNGFHRISEYKRSLKPGGVYVQIGGAGAQITQAMLLGPLVSLAGKKKLCSLGVARPSREDLNILGELLKEKKVIPVIDRTYSLEEVPHAFRYVNKGHAKGKVIINISDKIEN